MSLYLIAEIGINHNGDLDIAKKLIDSASDAGFDAVKFQKRTIELVYSKDFLEQFRESPWGKTQRDQKCGLEFGQEQYEEINEYCKSRKIAWSASAWDIESQRFLQQFDLPFNKIASPMLGHIPFLREVAKEQKKTYISTGMSTLDEIDTVVDIFRSEKCPFELMHCVSTYPMKESDANLLCIPMLKDRYKVNVGYSGHETSLSRISVAAVALGASSIERHITLDRAMYGSDQAASVQAHALKNFVEAVRVVKDSLGSGTKIVTDGEYVVREKLRVNVDG